MRYYVHVLKTYYAGGTARTIKNTPPHCGVRCRSNPDRQREITPFRSPHCFGFSLRRHDGSKIYRWLKTETGMPRGPKGEERPPT